MSRRNFTTLLSIIFIIFFPYWIYLPAILLGVIFLPLYWEALLMSFLVEVLHGAGASFASTIPFITLTALLFLILIRERIRLYV